MTTTDLKDRAIIALPFKGHAQTIISDDGTIAYFKGSFEDYQLSHPELDLKIISWEEFDKLHNEFFTSPFTEITEDHYQDMLNCLPPVKWHNITGRYNVFFMSERLSGNITGCYLLDRNENKYYSANISIFSTDSDIMKMIERQIEGLTIENLNLITTDKLNTGHWLEENLLRIRTLAESRGYIRILSHTQCEWTDKGIERFK